MNEYEQMVNALVALGLLSSASVSRSYATKVFTKWAASRGFTEANYGTKWDDAALYALIQEGLVAGGGRSRGRTFRGLGAGKITEEGDQGGSLDYNANLTPENAFINPYSPPPAVTVENAWQTPGPVVEKVPEESGSVWDKIFGTIDRGSQSVAKMVDIFGRQINPQSGRPIQPQAPSTPIWVYLTIPVALLGVVALMRRKPSSVGGYRRRSRRSR